MRNMNPPDHQPWLRQYAVRATPVGYYATLLALGEAWTGREYPVPMPLVPLLGLAQATAGHPLYGNTAMGYVLDDMTNFNANIRRRTQS